MTNIFKVAAVLRKNTQSPGITAAKIAKIAGIQIPAVTRAVYRLRNELKETIYTNSRKVRGETKSFYRMAV